MVLRNEKSTTRITKSMNSFHRFSHTQTNSIFANYDFVQHWRLIQTAKYIAKNVFFWTQFAQKRDVMTTNGFHFRNHRTQIGFSCYDPLRAFQKSHFAVWWFNNLLKKEEGAVYTKLSSINPKKIREGHPHIIFDKKFFGLKNA